MAAAKSLSGTLAELRVLGQSPTRPPRPADAAASLARLIAASRTLEVQERAGGLSFRMTGQTEQLSTFTVTCVVHAPCAEKLTTAEAAVVDLLCDGRTRAQIARLRGVSLNTVKSQIRQIFRKLDVESRVALVRRWCP